MGKVGSGQVIGAKSAVTTSYCVARKLQETKRQFLKMIQNLINIFKIRSGWNKEVDGQTIHLTENFISMNLLQMSCMIT